MFLIIYIRHIIVCSSKVVLLAEHH